MRTEKELAGTIRAAMKRKKLTKDHVAQTLKVNPIMLDKILCGDVVPSKHLEKQMIEHFGIGEQRVTKLRQRRERRDIKPESIRRKAA